MTLWLLMKRYIGFLPNAVNVCLVLLCIHTGLKTIQAIVTASYSANVTFLTKKENGEFHVLEVRGDKSAPIRKEKLTLASLGIDAESTRTLTFQRKVGEVLGVDIYCGAQIQDNRRTDDTTVGAVCTFSF